MWSSIKNTAAGAAIIALCVLLYWPRPHQAQPVPAQPPQAEAPIDRELDAPQAPACNAIPAAAAEAKKKTCSPACKKTEVCIDGVCCQPAVGLHGALFAESLWVADSLR